VLCLGILAILLPALTLASFAGRSPAAEADGTAAVAFAQSSAVTLSPAHPSAIVRLLNITATPQSATLDSTVDGVLLSAAGCAAATPLGSAPPPSAPSSTPSAPSSAAPAGDPPPVAVALDPSGQACVEVSTRAWPAADEVGSLMLTTAGAPAAALALTLKGTGAGLPPITLRAPTGAARVLLPGASVADGTVLGYVVGPSAQLVAATARVEHGAVYAELPGLKAGTYTGALDTSPGVDGGSVAITLRVHRSGWLALLLLVLGGVVVGLCSWYASTANNAWRARRTAKALKASILAARGGLQDLGSAQQGVPKDEEAIAGWAVDAAIAHADDDDGSAYDVRDALQTLTAAGNWITALAPEAVAAARAAVMQHVAATEDSRLLIAFATGTTFTDQGGALHRPQAAIADIERLLGADREPKAADFAARIHGGLAQARTWQQSDAVFEDLLAAIDAKFAEGGATAADLRRQVLAQRAQWYSQGKLGAAPDAAAISGLRTAIAGASANPPVRGAGLLGDATSSFAGAAPTVDLSGSTAISLATPEELRADGAKLERASRRMASANLAVSGFVLLIGFLLGISVGFSQTYLANPAWGSDQDLWQAVLWSVGVSGAVTVTRQLSTQVGALFASGK
jgi:hypothetical protein